VQALIGTTSPYSLNLGLAARSACMLEVSSFLLLQEGSVLQNFLMMGEALRNLCQLSALPMASMESFCAV